MKRNIFHILIIASAACILLACNPSRLLKDGEYLVNKNIVTVDSKDIVVTDVENYIKQKPNRKVLFFFRFHLGVYNISHEGKEKWWKKFFGIYKMGNIIGEPPVILDTLLTAKSVKQIKLYLDSKGYFNSKVRKEIIYGKKKKAAITYIANVSQPYCIKSLKYSIPDEPLKSFVLADTANSLIKSGKHFDTDNLQSERERITTNLKNQGFFYFTKEFITYDIDSAFGNHQLEIKMIIRDPLVKSDENPDSLITVPHIRYKLNEINIYPDYYFIYSDTSAYKKYPYLAAQRKKSATPTVYNFYYKKNLRIKPKTITQAVFFQQGNNYELDDVDKTYNRLIELKMFKFVNIQFSEPKEDTSENHDVLNCDIQLTRTPVQSFSAEAEATNSAGNLGVAGNLVYMNKNVFRGAEIFNFKITGATEIQKVFGVSNDKTNIQKLLPFNTVETGALASINIPKFLIPVKQERFPKYFKPKTTINVGINYQKRADYTRYIVNVSYGYDWKESQYKEHIVSFPELNSVKISRSHKFDSLLNLTKDPKIINSYQDHMIEAIKYSFIFNGQKFGKSNNFSWFRINGEVSGIPLRQINKYILNSYHYADGSYKLFYIKYAEYERVDADYRHYFVFNELNTVALRVAGGEGLAWGNSTVLPFEKSFYSGGSNSIRAWKIYTLGPGSYRDTSKTPLDKTGDINLEGNVEYRFRIYKLFKGALFVDAGNIWLNKKNLQIPGGEFELNRFYKEIAIALGLGVRFDFSFFVVRLDGAIKVRDPSMPELHRWLPFSTGIKTPILNLGIGYPF